MRCERCWSEDDVKEFRRPSASGETVPLCRGCRDAAPANEALFNSLFLRFASPKELLGFYDTSDEVEALQRWCDETKMELGDLRAILADEVSSMGLLSGPDLPVSEVVRRAPYGYAWEDRTILPSPLEAEVIRNVFYLYLRGKSLEGIRRLLNDARVPAPRGGEWHRSAIRYILRNPIYVGYRRRKGMLRKSLYPTIIGSDRFDRVQMLLSRRCRRPDQRVRTSPVLRGI